MTTGSLNISADTTSTVLENLRKYTDYQVRVAAGNNAGQGVFSSDETFRTSQDGKFEQK